MPLTIPTLDDRRYQDLLDETLARIPVHNPEWTNFNRSDPGVTLIELFAFLTESLLYRSNQIPERNRRKFLTLLGVPLRPASSARGLVVFQNERGPLSTITLNDDLEVRAGQVPFRSEAGLDVLPVEAQVYYKRRRDDVPDETRGYYEQLYASYGLTIPTTFALYETTPLVARGGRGVDLGTDTVDGSLWIALLVRAGDRPYASFRDAAREAIAGKTISLGVVPYKDEAGGQLSPSGPTAQGASLLSFEIPQIAPPDQLVPARRYRPVDARASGDVLDEPGIVEITLPAAGELQLWDNLDPLEAGVDDYPPALEDTNLGERVITWLRISSPAAVQARLLWVGINATMITQRATVAEELLPDGTGEPDQVVTLARRPIVPGSVRLNVTPPGDKREVWAEIDDLLSAGPEVPVSDLRLPPGTPAAVNPLVKVFAVDAEAGTIRFGDGLRGSRPPLGATIRADYAYGLGRAGNLGAEAITSSPALPAGLKVTNPVATWGGADAESVGEGEKQIARYLQHRERVVSADDFETITLRTPGVDIGRVDVLAAFNPELYSPELATNAPGDAPGAVTVMVIPAYDPVQPDAPLPDQTFINAVCDHLDPRRLVTTEVFVRGPIYKQIWISVGIRVVPGESIAVVREAVRTTLLQFLAPLPPDGREGLAETAPLLSRPASAGDDKGWPLSKPVVDRELLAVAARVPGVLLVNAVLIAQGTNAPTAEIAISGLELPRVMGIAVSVGDATSLDDLRGLARGGDGGDGTTPGGQPRVRVLPVPIVPEECR
ncbi:MAG: putative baseplate assembly protein [Chloroflexales bacterium]|nr:putative baseplate assembly protein [Chloroflexales bacterium]